MKPKPSDDDQPLLAGRNPVREALEDAGNVEKVWLQQGIDSRVASEIRSLAKTANVPVQVVPSRRMEHMAPGINHQGVMARIAALRYADYDEMLSAAAPDRDHVTRDKPIFVYLDSIQDPHNLGAILRSAVAAGASGAILPAKNSAPVNAAALKASAGMALRIPVARVTNAREALLQAKERGYWVAGADVTGAETVWTMDWDRPLIMVIGGESGGMRPDVAAACDFTVRIPMRGKAESLNASVAAGLLLFAAVRHRA